MPNSLIKIKKNDYFRSLHWWSCFPFTSSFIWLYPSLGNLYFIAHPSFLKACVYLINKCGNDARFVMLMHVQHIENNWRTGQHLLQRIHCHSETSKGVYCLQYDDNKIISGLRDNTIKVCHLAEFSSICTLYVVISITQFVAFWADHPELWSKKHKILTLSCLPSAKWIILGWMKCIVAFCCVVLHKSKRV